MKSTLKITFELDQRIDLTEDKNLINNSLLAIVKAVKRDEIEVFEHGVEWLTEEDEHGNEWLVEPAHNIQTVIIKQKAKQ